MGFLTINVNLQQETHFIWSIVVDCFLGIVPWEENQTYQTTEMLKIIVL